MKIKDIGNVVTGKTPQTAHAEFYGGDYMFIKFLHLKKHLQRRAWNLSKLILLME